MVAMRKQGLIGVRILHSQTTIQSHRYGRALVGLAPQRKLQAPQIEI